MEEMSRGDTIPNTPEHPTTPLENMEEDDMRRIHPILPSNATLNAAGDNGPNLARRPAYIASICGRTRELARSGPVP